MEIACFKAVVNCFPTREYCFATAKACALCACARVDFRFSFLGMSQILGAPKHGIGGIFEMCIGCASLEELAAQERYWGLYGFFEDTSETRRGSLAAEDAARLYGVPSALISVRLYHRASRADHGLVRLWCFTDAEARPSVAARLGSLRCKGARWGAQARWCWRAWRA